MEAKSCLFGEVATQIVPDDKQKAGTEDHDTTGNNHCCPDPGMESKSRLKEMDDPDGGLGQCVPL